MNMLPPKGDRSNPKSLEHFLALMSRLYQRLEAIRQTVGLDASVLGEEAIPKNFVLLVEKISGEDCSVIRLLEQQMEQFTRDPRDALVEILKERGLEWIKSLPSGIGAYKSGDREGLFVLFTDGKDVYWRLRYFDKPETRTDPTSIIEVLKGDENKGQRIDYQKLIDRLRKVKAELLHELEESEARRRTREGIPTPSTKKAREIYTALGQVDERLAAMFRRLSGRKPLVDQLYRAMGRGMDKLVEMARELLLKQTGEEAPPAAREIRVRRICWCWISPSLGDVK
jgi:hypothetical protein